MLRRICIYWIFFYLPLSAEQLNVEVMAEAALLINADTGGCSL